MAQVAWESLSWAEWGALTWDEYDAMVWQEYGINPALMPVLLLAHRPSPSLFPPAQRAIVNQLQKSTLCRNLFNGGLSV